MHLHRSTGEPDWADIPTEQHNTWQRLAAATHSLITPGNLITLIGLAGVIYGLMLLSLHHYWSGLGLLIAGRLCDIVDGLAAERTGTKSPLGEAFDVTADKLGVLGTITVFFSLHLAPSWLLVAMLVPQLLTTILTVVAYLGKYPLHPSRIGKYAMAGVWVVMAGFVAAQAFSGAPGLRNTFDVLAVVVSASGFYAAYEYAQGRD